MYKYTNITYNYVLIIRILGDIRVCVYLHSILRYNVYMT